MKIFGDVHEFETVVLNDSHIISIYTTLTYASSEFEFEDDVINCPTYFGIVTEGCKW